MEEENWKQKYDDLNEEFLDFTASSQELEKELEKEIEVKDKKISQLNKDYAKLEYEINVLKKQKQDEVESLNSTVSRLQRDISEYEKTHSVLKQSLQKTEQANDDLERECRIVRERLSVVTENYESTAASAEWLKSESEQFRVKAAEDNQRLRDTVKELEDEVAYWKAQSSSGSALLAGQTTDHIPAESTTAQGADGSSALVDRPQPDTDSAPLAPITPVEGTLGRVSTPSKMEEEEEEEEVTAAQQQPDSSPLDIDALAPPASSRKRSLDTANYSADILKTPERKKALEDSARALDMLDAMLDRVKMLEGYVQGCKSFLADVNN